MIGYGMITRVTAVNSGGVTLKHIGIPCSCARGVIELLIITRDSDNSLGLAIEIGLQKGQEAKRIIKKYRTEYTLG